MKREILIDWFQFTLKFESNFFNRLEEAMCNDYNAFVCKYILRHLFGADFSDITNDFSAKNGYTRCFNYKNIQVMCNDNYDYFGFNVLLTGTGCRDFESLNLSWTELFEKIILIGEYNINRIDIAIDSINTNDYTIDLLYGYLEKKQVCSKFRTCLNINSFNSSRL